MVQDLGIILDFDVEGNLIDSCGILDCQKNSELCPPYKINNSNEIYKIVLEKYNPVLEKYNLSWGSNGVDFRRYNTSEYDWVFEGYDWVFARTHAPMSNYMIWVNPNNGKIISTKGGLVNDKGKIFSIENMSKTK